MKTKNKTPITKSIALVLCIITITLSQNIYSSYKDLYFKEDLFENSIIYTAIAKTSLNDLNIPNSDSALPLTDISAINNNKDYQQKKIFINIIILFLSFIILASLHNFILKIENARGYTSINIGYKVKNKKSNINLTSSLVSEEGVK